MPRRHDILAIMTPKRTKRFWQRVDSSGGFFACWPWISPNVREGYGLLQGSNRYEKWSLSAHRVALALHTKQQPDGLVAMHACDNRICCNPLHLSWGTHSENLRDAREKASFRKSAPVLKAESKNLATTP